MPISMSHAAFRSILITGASSGIGEAVAVALAVPGRHLALNGRNHDRLAAVAERCRQAGASVSAKAFDVSSPRVMQEFIDAAEAAAPLDLVIANAGISGGPGDGVEGAPETARMFEINLIGTVNTVVPSAAAMRRRKQGHIAVLSSLAGLRAMPTAPAYSASKLAIRAWAEAIRPGLADDGIGLSIICPGFVESRITAANRFPMPFLMPAERAASIILDGLARRRRVIAFPWQTALIARMVAALPGPLFDALMRRAPNKGK